MKFNWKTINKPILGLSPMADMTDSAFSKTIRDIVNNKIKNSRLVIFREMISAEAIVRGNVKTENMAVFSKQERPIIQQIFGSNPDTMAKAAQIIEEKFKPDGIDINMGCPVQKMVKHFNGAALMKNPKLASDIIIAVKSTITIPLSIKTRTGWDDETSCLEFSKRMEAAGADLITIHGRTRTQGYSGKSNRKIVEEVKKNLSIPVLYNGDIFTWQDYFKALDETQCDGALIARGALGNPWIFKQIEQKLNNQKPDDILITERISVVLQHLDFHLNQYGDDKITTFRKHLAWYFKNIPNFKKYRQQLMTTTDKNELKMLLFKIEQEYNK